MHPKNILLLIIPIMIISSCSQDPAKIVNPDPKSGIGQQGPETPVVFNEEAYLNAFKDVADAVKAGTFASGEDHYNKFGKDEKRLDRPEYIAAFREGFNEEAYLKAFPDVADNVKSGPFLSGMQHYLQFGKTEKRLERPEYIKAKSELKK
jgi:hypothetical protein